jgi:hypothetical protein
MKGLSVLVTFALLAFAHFLKGHLQQAGRLPADQRARLERPGARPAAHTDIILVAKKANTHAWN